MSDKQTIEECQKLAMEYGQLHEDECDLNTEDGSFDGCDCAMKQLVEEVATKAYEAGQVEQRERTEKHMLRFTCYQNPIRLEPHICDDGECQTMVKLYAALKAKTDE